jgi:hypothetical protein
MFNSSTAVPAQFTVFAVIAPQRSRAARRCRHQKKSQHCSVSVAAEGNAANGYSRPVVTDAPVTMVMKNGRGAIRLMLA